MEKSIMLDVKIQRRKGDYDLFNHYVSGDIDGEINDGYSLKSAFKDFIMYLEDNNSRESRGIQYYVYDKSDEKICFTNSKKNLRKAFESNDKNILRITNGIQLLILMKMGMFLYKEVSLTIGKALSTIHPLINSLKTII